MKNIDGVEITRPNQKLIIMRAVSGAGKSTAAKGLLELFKDGVGVPPSIGVIHSTDTLIEQAGDYDGLFKRMIETEDFSDLARFHGQNLKNAITSIREGVSPVIIDNTNLKMRDIRPYVETALALGLDDKNIQIIDLGTNGKTAEELAERNTHNVPLEKIKMMIETHKSSGPVTVKRIIETRDPNKVLFSAAVLDEASRNKLLTALGHRIPANWETIAKHMTIIFGKALPLEMKHLLGQTISMRATEIGVSDMAIAVKIEDAESTNKIPHVTLAVNRAAGGTPVMSNAITDWVKLDNYINLKAEVREIKRNDV